MSNATPITVREEHHVKDDVDSAVAKWPFAEDAFEAAKWRIARDPECGTPVSQTDAHPPGILVRYYQLPTVVVIDWVRFYPFDDGAAVLPGAYQVA